jgi:hypothetical protein
MNKKYPPFLCVHLRICITVLWYLWTGNAICCEFASQSWKVQDCFPRNNRPSFGTFECLKKSIRDTVLFHVLIGMLQFSCYYSTCDKSIGCVSFWKIIYYVCRTTIYLMWWRSIIVKENAQLYETQKSNFIYVTYVHICIG